MNRVSDGTLLLDRPVDVMTLGKDAVPGGDGDDADVSYSSIVAEDV